MDQYFQEKKFTFLVDPVAYSSMQDLRSQYLLSGKGLNSVPTITDVVSGLLLYTFYNLREDIHAVQSKNKGKPLLLNEAMKAYSSLMIEGELSPEEFDDLASTISTKTNTEMSGTEFSDQEISASGIERRSQRIELNKAEQINMIVREDDLNTIKGLEALINELRGTRHIYSVSDIIRSTISLITGSNLKRGYFAQSYIPHLYGLEVREYFKFNYEFPNIPNSINMKRLEAVLIDERVIMELSEEAEKIRPYYEKKRTKKAGLILENSWSNYDRYWSYMSNFNYLHAFWGMEYGILGQMLGADFTSLINGFRAGGLDEYFKVNAPPVDTFLGHVLLVFQLYTSNLMLFTKRLRYMKGR